MGSVGGHRGLWGFVRGGMGAVSNAIADSARSRGVEIRTNARVEAILVENGRARGVAVEGGEEIGAPVVASNLTPHSTCLQLVDARELQPEFLDAIRKLRGDKLQAARLLGIGKTTLYRKLKEYGIADPLREE